MFYIWIPKPLTPSGALVGPFVVKREAEDWIRIHDQFGSYGTKLVAPILPETFLACHEEITNDNQA